MSTCVQIRGRGLDLPLLIKDINLIKWIGANSFRTSHYPYSEELMDMCDATGIMVINECPAVGLRGFSSNQLLQNHQNSIRELLQRDRNRPSTVMWSIANEPDSSNGKATEYFRQIVQLTKYLDNSRPVSAAINADVMKDHLAQFLDVIMINRYYSWYSDTGSLETIYTRLVPDLTEWHQKHSKPIMMSEYGADTVSGLHSSPSFVFTEDYQTELMLEHFKSFDTLRSKNLLIGEMIWNFADFMTIQQTSRVQGNKKGVFTRERQPKTSARFLRCRYLTINNVTDETDGHMYCPRM